MRVVIKIFLLFFLFFHCTVPLVAISSTASSIDCSNIRSIWNNVATTNISDIQNFITNLKNFIKNCVVQPSLVIVIVVSGVYIMASTGNPGNIQKGKVALIGALIGITIVSLAGEMTASAAVAIVFGIIIFVISSVVK